MRDELDLYREVYLAAKALVDLDAATGIPIPQDTRKRLNEDLRLAIGELDEYLTDA